MIASVSKILRSEQKRKMSMNFDPPVTRVLCLPPCTSGNHLAAWFFAIFLAHCLDLLAEQTEEKL